MTEKFWFFLAILKSDPTQLVISIIAHNRPTEARLEKKKNPLKLQYAFSILNYKVAPIFLQYLENTLLQSQHVGPWIYIKKIHWLLIWAS